MWPDSEDENEYDLTLQKLDSFEIEDNFESKIPPLTKSGLNSKSEGLEFTEELKESISQPLKLTKTIR